jgi:hypothetical protein
MPSMVDTAETGGHVTDSRISVYEAQDTLGDSVEKRSPIGTLFREAIRVLCHGRSSDSLISTAAGLKGQRKGVRARLCTSTLHVSAATEHGMVR